jgi:hypothetical protein
MKSKRQLDVDEWSEPTPPTRMENRSGSSRLSVRMAGVIGTLLIHVIAFQSVLMGTTRHKVRAPEAQGAGASPMKSETAPTDTLVLVEVLTPITAAPSFLENLASNGSAPKSMQITLASPDPLPLVAIDSARDQIDASADAAVDSGDAAGRALLFGRYTGQIDARIERAWRRPRTPVLGGAIAEPIAPKSGATEPKPDGIFSCRVRMVQDGHGRVEEVQMLDCNGAAEWQQSLVRAIFASSPLPAPPSPSVFSRTITITFVGREFAPGAELDDYEPASAPSVVVSNRLGSPPT